MPNKKDYDWNYRPESYWEEPADSLNNIKGEARRHLIAHAISAGEYDDIPDEILKDELSDDVRRFAGTIHPAFMGGEYLPPYLPGEVEIVRVSMESVTYDVLSIRARRTDDGLIHYRMVDEYEDPGDGSYKCRPETSSQPLTFGELVSLIDSSKRIGLKDESIPDLATYLRDYNYECERCKYHLDSLIDFVHVSSPFYPELEEWYEADAQEWYETRLAELRAEEPESPTANRTQCPRCLGSGSIEDMDTGLIVDCPDCGGMHGDGLVPISAEALDCGSDCAPAPVAVSQQHWLEDYTVKRPCLTYTADKEILCDFSTLVVKTEALRQKFDGGLSAFIERHEAQCNRDIAVLFDMATGYLDDAIEDLDLNGLVFGEDYLAFESYRYTWFRDEGQEVDLEVPWLTGRVKDVGMVVSYTG